MSLVQIILPILSAILVAVISFILGRWAERRKQLLLLRSDELKTIEEWLQGAEKLVSILGDTLVAVHQNLKAPVLYDLSERKTVFQFLSERTNAVLSIINSSKDLQTKQTQKLINDLSEVLQELDILLKYQLLPIENEIVGRSNTHQLTENDLMQGLKIKTDADELLQKAYRSIRRIKMRLT